MAILSTLIKMLTKRYQCIDVFLCLRNYSPVFHLLLLLLPETCWARLTRAMMKEVRSFHLNNVNKTNVLTEDYVDLQCCNVLTVHEIKQKSN